MKIKVQHQYLPIYFGKTSKRGIVVIKGSYHNSPVGYIPCNKL